MKKRLFIVSVDAMVREDVEYLKTRPNFGRYMKNACEITHMRTIAPTITYPVHSAMISGCYPEKTGILNNDGFTIGNNGKKWLWFANAKQCDDLFFEAKKAGYSTASICWPVTGCHPAIDYLIDEYWMQGSKSTLKGTYRDVGSSDEVLSIIEHNKNQLPEGWEKPGKANFTRQPWFDNFLVANACEIIRRYTPELVAIHLNYVDGIRHETGVFNSQVTHVLDLVDVWIGSLMHALEESGVLADTNIVITSDHGQMDIKRVMKPNVFLADHGYITLNEDGVVKSWKAYAFSGGMNAYVVMKDPQDKSTWKTLYDLLSSMANEGIYGFSQVFTRQEIKEQEHVDGPFSFYLETDGFTSFSNSCVRPVVVNSFDASDYRSGKATHGYLPDKGPQPVFLAVGPDFKKNVIIERRPVVDLAPTWAKLLGVPLPEADGRPILAFLKDQ